MAALTLEDVLNFRQKAVANADNDDAADGYIQTLSRFITTSPTGSCFFHSHTELAADALRIILSTLSSNDVESAKIVLGQSLKQCVECINAYHDAKKVFAEGLKALHTEEEINQVYVDTFPFNFPNTSPNPFLTYRTTNLFHWDVDRQRRELSSLATQYETILANSAVDPRKQISALRQSSAFVLYEILNFPEVLQDPEVDELYRRVTVPEKHRNGLKLNVNIFPGVLLGRIHADPLMRARSHRALDATSLRFTSATLPAAKPYIEIILSALAGRPATHTYSITEDRAVLWEAGIVVLGLCDEESFRDVVCGMELEESFVRDVGGGVIGVSGEACGVFGRVVGVKGEKAFSGGLLRGDERVEFVSRVVTVAEFGTGVGGGGVGVWWEWFVPFCLNAPREGWNEWGWDAVRLFIDRIPYLDLTAQSQLTSTLVTIVEGIFRKHHEANPEILLALLFLPPTPPQPLLPLTQTLLSHDLTTLQSSINDRVSNPSSRIPQIHTSLWSHTALLSLPTIRQTILTGYFEALNVDGSEESKIVLRGVKSAVEGLKDEE
ncbi:hypothetical protein HDV00_010017, partial [Rhizophlyctis rosea]